MIVQYEVTTLVRQVFLGPTIRDDALQIACGDLSNPLIVCRRFDLLRTTEGPSTPALNFRSGCAPGRIARRYAPRPSLRSGPPSLNAPASSLSGCADQAVEPACCLSAVRSSATGQGCDQAHQNCNPSATSYGGNRSC